MNHLSHWANRHRRAAIGLIVLLETIKITAGMNLGRYGLPALPPDVLTYLTLAVAAAVFTVQRRHQRAEAGGYLTRPRLRRDLLLVFQGGYLLSILAGNACQNFFGDPGGYPLWSAQSLEMRRDTISPEPARAVYYVEKKQEELPKRKGLGWRIAAYALLTALGFLSGFVATAAGCSLLCGNEGVWLVVALSVIVGGYGFAMIATGIFKGILSPTHLKKMTRDGRRRETLGAVIGAMLGLIVLVIAALLSA